MAEKIVFNRGQKVLDMINTEGFEAAYKYAYGVDEIDYYDKDQLNFTYFISSKILIDIMKFINSLYLNRSTNEELDRIVNLNSYMLQSMVSSVNKLNEEDSLMDKSNELSPEDICDIKNSFINKTISLIMSSIPMIKLIKAMDISNIDGMDELLKDIIEISRAYELIKEEEK